MSTPTIPNAQAPVAVMPSGVMAREWFAFLTALLAVAVAQEARLAALEARITALETPAQ